MTTMSTGRRRAEATAAGLGSGRLVSVPVAIPAGIWNGSGEVYNPDSGRGNSCSIFEVFEMVERPTGKRMKCEYVDAARAGDPSWYTGDLRRLCSYYPEWLITRSRDHILRKIVKGGEERL